jgi:IrrE N-terminal-like domain
MAKKPFTPFNLPIPGWNERRMTSEDFKQVCEREGIKVESFRFKGTTRGLCTIRDGKVHILIDERLRVRERVFVEFHELGHYFFHLRNKRAHRALDSNFDSTEENLTPAQEWAEVEANLAGSVAIAPGFYSVESIRYLGAVASRHKWGKR